MWGRAARPELRRPEWQLAYHDDHSQWWLVLADGSHETVGGKDSEWLFLDAVRPQYDYSDHSARYNSASDITGTVGVGCRRRLSATASATDLIETKMTATISSN